MSPAEARLAEVVVATDLVVPRLPSPLVERERLFDTLDRGVREGVLTLVCAHAGTGKTVLLSSWAAARRPPCLAWVTLRPQGGEAAFWARLAGALSPTVPLEPPRRRASTAFLNRLLNGFAALDGPVVVVLDDFHTAPPGLAAAIGSILHAAPDQLRLVVASRTDPSLPLHLLRVGGGLTEIRAADLRFAPDEARPLLPALDGAELDAAVAWTEGWAAGIRLLAVSPRAHGGGDWAALAEEERTVADYLAAEVLAAQPPELRRFLLRTSVVDRLTGDLADALTGGVDGDRTLARLLRDNLFVDQVEGGWYRYHRLFVELLRSEARVELRRGLGGLQVRAARWHARHGDPVEAVRLALAARRWELAAELLAANWLEVVVRGDAEIAAGLVDGVPAEFRRSSPLLAALTALLQLSTGSTQRASALLDAAERSAGDLPPELRAVLDGIVAHGRLLAARRRGDFRRTIRLARPLCDDDERAGRALALCALGAGHLWRGAADRAGPALEEACELAREERLLHVELDALGQLALLQLVRGRLRHADRLARHAVEAGKEHGAGGPEVAAAHAALALVAHLWGDLGAAAADAARARELARAAGDAPAGALACLAEALVELSRGAGPAEPGSHRLGEAAAAGGPLLRPLALAAEARLLARAGHQDEAEATLARGLRSFPGNPALLAARARIELAAGDADRAAATLDEALPAASARTARIEVLALAAVARRAPAALEEALALAEPEGIRRPFLDCGPPMRELLADLVRSGTRHRWLAAELIQSLDGRAPESRGPAELLDPLSDRERDVLRYLPTMLSNADIAAELFLSVNTVKTHVKAIYRKLGVTRRRDAVHRARQLRLL